MGSTPAAPRSTPLATVALTLAGVLVWQSIALVADRDAAVSKFRLDVWLPLGAARTTVVVIAVLGVLAAGLLVAERTRVLGAAAATSGLLLLATYLVVAWGFGHPVQCLCSTRSPVRDSFAHVEAIVVVLAAALLCGFVGVASRRRSSRS